jgi:heme/copper-type cytochrome/quinol oxidase subunit 2
MFGSRFSSFKYNLNEGKAINIKINVDEEFIEFNSYLIPESNLKDRALRMLKVNNRVILPELIHVRFIITAIDIIHSFACLTLSIKCNAYFSRLN